MRSIAILAAAALVFTPLTARAQAMNDDPDMKVAGGIMVKGWTARVDRANQKVEETRFEDMGGGYHITSGPHAIYWNPANAATGNYTVKATLSKTKGTPHAESYGLFIAGSDLDGPGQNYLYCVVFGDGIFSVIHRAGGETHPLASRKAHEAVSKASASGTAKDEIAMSVAGGRVTCSINGKEVWSEAASNLIGAGKLPSTNGVFGLRASHNLSIHVAGFGMTGM